MTLIVLFFPIQKLSNYQHHNNHHKMGGGSSSSSQPPPPPPPPPPSPPPPPPPVQKKPEPKQQSDPILLKKISRLERKVQTMEYNVQTMENTIYVLKKQLAQAEKEARRLKNPKIYRQLKEEAWNTFYQNLAKVRFQDVIQRKPGQKHHMLIGNISAGKTSLINFACNLKLKVGMGQTTTQACRVCTNQLKMNIWDSPGSNEDFSFYDINILKLFWSMDRIFIVYCDSLKSCPELVKALYKVKPKSTFLVRSMCDRGENEQSKTIQQELETDQHIIKGWGINLRILATSSRRDMAYLDNQAFCELLVK